MAASTSPFFVSDLPTSRSFSALRGAHWGWSGAEFTAESTFFFGLGCGLLEGGALAGGSWARTGPANRKTPDIVKLARIGRDGFCFNWVTPPYPIQFIPG